MKYSYVKNNLTLQAGEGEMVRYRRQSLEKARETNTPYTNLSSGQSVTITMNNSRECIEVLESGKDPYYLGPSETFNCTVRFTKKAQNGGFVLEYFSPLCVHLSHFYLDVDGKKVYLGTEPGAHGMKWHMNSNPCVCVEDYCRDILNVVM